VNPAIQGRSYPQTPPYLVGREKVREFARAVLATDLASLDVEAARAAGFADLVAPPTFAVVVQEHSLTQLLTDPEAGIDFTRVVHGDQRFSFTRPVVVSPEDGALLAVSAKVGAIDREARTARIDLTVRFGGDTVLGKAQVVVALD
jgi:hypothetical protein